MSVGVVKEERGLRLISLISHILTMQDSGPEVKSRKHVATRREKAISLPFLCSVIYEVIECRSMK